MLACPRAISRLITSSNGYWPQASTPCASATPRRVLPELREHTLDLQVNSIPICGWPASGRSRRCATAAGGRRGPTGRANAQVREEAKNLACARMARLGNWS